VAPVLGIDLGTTNSVVAVADGHEVRVLLDEEGQRLIPSVVSFHPHGDVLVGFAARDRRLIDAKNTVYSVKRLLGRPWGSPEVERARERFGFTLREGPNKGVLVEARGETFTLPEISAFVLREVRRVAERALGDEVSGAVITCPANFNELQRAATKAAGKVAGLDVLRILNEPTAAALAYGYGGVAQGGKSRERIAIFDLGGGTFDITILELAGDVFEVLATAGDTFLGGDDLDLMVADRMAEAFLRQHRFDLRSDAQAFERLRAAAEWAKCQLTTEADVKIRVEELAYGRGGGALDLAFAITQSELEAMASPLVEKTLEVCDEALRLAHVATTQLDNVILVGGSTRMPLVRRRVTEHFGRPPLATIDPDVVVAQGAALHGYALATGGARGSVPPPRPVGRVSLRKQTLTGEGDERRRELAAEAAEARPAQPAFAPAARPMPPPPPPPAAGFERFGSGPPRRARSPFGPRRGLRPHPWCGARCSRSAFPPRRPPPPASSCPRCPPRHRRLPEASSPISRCRAPLPRPGLPRPRRPRSTPSRCRGGRRRCSSTSPRRRSGSRRSRGTASRSSSATQRSPWSNRGSSPPAPTIRRACSSASCRGRRGASRRTRSSAGSSSVASGAPNEAA
jgi:molecular chaperone DnaK